MTRRPTLILFAKVPAAGRVKSRLGAGIGMTAAAWWYRHQLRRLVARLGTDPRWRTVLAVSPDAAGLVSRALPGGLVRTPQGQGDLGRRMMRALRAAAPGPALLIGSDIPGISRADIAAGFAALGRDDAVLGPARDGGYWMIGFRHPARLRPDRLDGVRWSTEHALRDTEARLSGLTIAHGPARDDVDTEADLARAQMSDRPIRMR